MNDAQNMDALYAKLEGPLAALQAKRDRRNMVVGIGLVLAALLALCGLCGVDWLFGLAVAVGGVALITGGILNRGLRGEFKRIVVDGVVEFCAPGMRYAPDSGFSEAEFKETELFQSRIDRYRTEDAVFGNIGETSMRFAEVVAERIDKHEKSKTTVTVFRGVLFKADFPKDFSSSLVVLPDAAESLFGSLVGGFLQRCNMVRGELVKLEDPEFERLFVVYGEDQQEARYLLSPKFMRRLVELRKRFDCDLFCSFRKSTLFLAVARSKNMFEMPLAGRMTDPSLLCGIRDDILTFTSIVEELDLNTRIWSK